MNRFRYICTLLLLTVLVASQFGTRELFKLPQLLAHYADTVSEKGEENFWNYLTNHYWIEDGTDADAAEDSQLPFRSLQYEYVITDIASIGLPIGLPATHFVYLGNGNFYHYHSQLPTRFIAPVWQPPNA